jgi:hypothetical protein
MLVGQAAGVCVHTPWRISPRTWARLRAFAAKQACAKSRADPTVSPLIQIMSLHDDGRIVVGTQALSSNSKFFA